MRTAPPELRQETAFTPEEVYDLYNNAPCGYHSLDAKGMFVRINDTELRWLGYLREEIVGRRCFIDLLTEESQERFYAQFPLFKQRGWVHDLEFQMIRRDGSCMDVLLSATALFGPRGEFLMTRSTIYDITERKRNEEALRQQADLLHLANDAIIVRDREDRITFWNRSAERLYGWTSAEVRGQVTHTLFNTLFPLGREVMDEVLHQEGVWEGELTHTCKDGRRVVVASRQALQTDSLGRPLAVVEINRDITEQKQQERTLVAEAERVKGLASRMTTQRDMLEQMNSRLEELAITDGLTGLKNHRAFQESLAEEFIRARKFGVPFSLLLMDVDHFKSYNDTFGHPAGDVVLRGVGATLQQCARDSDFVARYGGEEFAVILRETSHNQALIVADRMRVAIQEISGLARPITVSIGVATMPLSATDRPTLISEADRALYEAKHAGRNRVHFAVPSPS